MRSIAVDILLRAGGVASETAGWCSERCSEHESSRGGGILGRRSGLENGGVVLRKVLCWHVLSSVSGVPDEVRHMSQFCCRSKSDYYLPSPPSPSSRERRGADRSLLWFEKSWRPLHFEGERLR